MRVEISRSEFISTYDELMCDTYNNNMSCTSLDKDKVKEYVEKLNRDEQYQQALDSFRALFGLAHSEVIKRIADSHNMIVDNYGYHDGEVIIAVFIQFGDRM